MKNLIAVLSISFVLSSSLANAEDFDDTYQAYRSGKYEQELKLVKSPAKPNIEKILNAHDLDLYKHLAEQGDAMAQNNLGLMYEAGHGVTQDFDLAIYWLAKAAKQGSSEAQYNIGRMVYFGNGVAKDYVQAFNLYKKAAEQGDTLAQSAIGMMYARGEGIAQDFIRAHMWTNLAAIKGDEYVADNRDKLAHKLTREQRAEAQTLARECQKRNYKNCD